MSFCQYIFINCYVRLTNYVQKRGHWCRQFPVWHALSVVLYFALFLFGLIVVVDLFELLRFLLELVCDQSCVFGSVLAVAKLAKRYLLTYYYIRAAFKRYPAVHVYRQNLRVRFYRQDSDACLESSDGVHIAYSALGEYREQSLVVNRVHRLVEAVAVENTAALNRRAADVAEKPFFKAFIKKLLGHDKMRSARKERQDYAQTVRPASVRGSNERFALRPARSAGLVKILGTEHYPKVNPAKKSDYVVNQIFKREHPAAFFLFIRLFAVLFVFV